MIISIVETTDGDGWAMTIGNGKPVLAANAQTAFAAVQKMRRKLPNTKIEVRWRTATRAGAQSVASLSQK